METDINGSENSAPMEGRGQRTFSLWQLFSFGVLTTPLAMGGLAMVMYLPTFYAIDMGLGLGLVGAVFVAGRLFDILTDPLVGHWSDETRSRFGPRKPWMMAGVIGFSLSVCFFFSPPPGAGLGYLILTSGLYFLFYTILDVPYSSIGLEVSPHVHERSMLASSKALFQVVGAISAAAIPFLLTLSIADSLDMIAKIIIGLSAIGFVMFLLFVPNRQRVVTAPRLGLLAALKAVLKRRRYRYLIGTFLIIQTANSFVAGLTVLHVTYIIGAPDLVGMFLGILLLSSALFLPLWVILSKRYDKKKSWMVSIVTCILVLALTPLLGENDVLGAAIFCFIIGGAFGCDAIMPTSMLADIVYEQEQGGESRLGGLYLAVKNSVSKLSFVAPMGLAFPVLGYIQFEKLGVSEPGSKMIFLTFYAALPILLRLAALYVLTKAPDFTTAPMAETSEP